MKQILLPILAATTFIIIVGMLYGSPNKAGSLFVTGTPTATPEVSKTLTIGPKELRVTLANTEESRMKGLSGVKSLPEDEGMLFVFESKDSQPAFWMKDMVIPIDIIWIKDAKVAKIDKDALAPEPSTPDAGLKLYRPDGPIDYVLEVNAGFCDLNKIKAGTPVDLSNI
jgi:uncharacterized membrane protein (UPF0127 family)